MNIARTIARNLKNILLYGHYIPTQYYIYEDKELIYMPIPKVACTSFKIAIMGENFEQSNNDYENYMDIHSKATRKHEYLSIKGHRNYYKFAFVRNPFDRLVSCYEDKVRKAAQHNGQYYFSSKYNDVLIRKLFGQKFSAQMTFTEFARLVAKIPDYLADAHFKSQYAFLYRYGKIIPDYVGKLENLPEDWEYIANKHDLDGLTSSNPTSRRPWPSYYDSKEIIELVATRYKNDIRAFGYGADYSRLQESLTNV